MPTQRTSRKPKSNAVFLGYVAVALAAFLGGYIVQDYGSRSGQPVVIRVPTPVTMPSPSIAPAGQVAPPEGAATMPGIAPVSPTLMTRTYRGVIEKVSKGTFEVMVIEGVASPATVKLAAGSGAKLTALVPRAAVTLAPPSADGQPPAPPSPTQNPYQEESRKLSDFKANDVIEFVSADPIAEGASVHADLVTWIFSRNAGPAPGPIGANGPTPTPPTTP